MSYLIFEAVRGVLKSKGSGVRLPEFTSHLYYLRGLGNSYIGAF